MELYHIRGRVRGLAYGILIIMDQFNTTNTLNDGTFFDWGLFRRDVRRDVRNCVLFLLFFYGVNLAASGIVIIISVFTSPGFWDAVTSASLSAVANPGGSPSIDTSAIMDAIAGQSGEVLGLASIVGIVAGGCVFLICRKRRFFTDVALPAAEPMTAKIFIVLIVVTQAVQIVYSLIVSLIDKLLPSGLSLEESYSSVMEGLMSPVGVLYIVLIGPIFEELIFRGAVFGALRRFGENYAILFSALLFGFYHMLILQIPFAFVLGLLLGYVASRWTLRASIALHIIVNGLSVLLSSTHSEVGQGVITLGMIVCAFATLIMAIAWRRQFWARVHTGAAYYARTYANGFSSIAFWIFIVIMAGAGLLQMNLMG